jgi:hypothetical protein
MNLQTVMNSPGMWLASSVMVIVVVVQSALFLREGFRAADKLGMERSSCIRGMRSAMITAIGPSLGPVVILLALLAVLGGPTTWMRMNDIGAARTELAMSALATKVIGVEMRSPAFDLKAFSYAIWGMAMNNAGWMLVSLIFVKRMNSAISKMNQKYNPAWVKLIMTGAAIGLFASLWAPALIRGGGQFFAGIVSFVSMFLISKYAGKYPRLQEPALGIAMLIGMFAAAYFF